MGYDIETSAGGGKVTGCRADIGVRNIGKWRVGSHKGDPRPSPRFLPAPLCSDVQKADDLFCLAQDRRGNRPSPAGTI